MALGGIFGVMNTMFAAVAQRIKDIGVHAHSRVQALADSGLVPAGIAGDRACRRLAGLAARVAEPRTDGDERDFRSGGGGGKTVILRLVVDAQVLMAGAIFTLVMGRLGGLIPALSATRLKILDTLRG